MLKDLAPDRWMLQAPKGEQAAHFDDWYVGKLENLGVVVVGAKLEGISAQNDGADLVLLCFEDVHAGEPCHRRTFGDWWFMRTGEMVEELPVGSPTASDPAIVDRGDAVDIGSVESL
jgi:hypothetical protein